MIKVKNLSNNTEHVVVPTIFNDKTSQVWKLPEELLIRSSKFKIVWHFESEAELIQLLQLNDLLRLVGSVVELFIPYFPYARQDKRISNEATFAQSTFIQLLKSNFNCRISVFDIHNPLVCNDLVLDEETLFNIAPEKYIVKSMIDAETDIICFPDKGAANRYSELNDFIVADKTRDQLTGKITGHELLPSNHNLEGKNVLIVDDLVDAGGTFISVAKMLKAAGANNIDLYVSHGIFSHGVHVLKEAGIRNIYTTDSFIGSSEVSKSLCTIYKLEE